MHQARGSGMLLPATCCIGALGNDLQLRNHPQFSTIFEHVALISCSSGNSSALATAASSATLLR